MSLLEILIKATALLAIAAIANRLLARRASASARHGLWTLAIAGLLALPLASLALPAGTLRLPILPAQNAGPASVAPGATAVASSAGVRDAGPRVTAPDPASGPTAARLPAISWPAIALSVYLAGVLLLVARLGRDQLAARRLVVRAEPIDDVRWTSLLSACASQLGVNQPVHLLRSAGDVMPMTVGLRRPAILLSRAAEGWSPDRRRAVILHELAHVARHDCLTQALASIAVALYRIHPGVWWVARRLQLEREYACDDLVLAAGSPAREYAGHLLEIAYSLGAHRAPALAVTMARTTQLEGRLLALLDAARNRATPGLAGRLAAAVCALLIVLPLAAISTTTRVAARTLPLIDTTAAVAVTAADPAPGAAAAGRVDQAAPADAATFTGTWEVQAGDRAGEVYLELRQAHSSSGRSVPLTSLDGLSAAQVAGNGPATFTLRRDAGSFRFTGTFRGGAGAGTYDFTPSPTFPAELATRGVNRPTPAEQHEMAKHDVGLALVDELGAAGVRDANRLRFDSRRPSWRDDRLRACDGETRLQGRHRRCVGEDARPRRDAGLRRRPHGRGPAEAPGRRPRQRARPRGHARLREGARRPRVHVARDSRR